MDTQLAQRIKERIKEAKDKRIAEKASDIARFLGDGKIRTDPLAEYSVELEGLKITDSFNGYYETKGKPRRDERYSLLEGKSWKVHIEYDGEIVFFMDTPGMFEPYCRHETKIERYKPGREWEQKLEDLHLKADDTKNQLKLSLEKEIQREQEDEVRSEEENLRERYGL